MTIDRLINILVSITLIEMMISIGLTVRFADVVRVARDGSLVTRAALANYVCVPAVTVGLLILFGAPPMVAAGFMIVAACPGAPYAAPFTALAKGNVAVAVGLMVILAGSSAIVAPLLLRFLLPLFSGDQPLKIDPVKMVMTLSLTQLLPLAAGIGLRERNESLAAKLQKPARQIATLLNLLVLVVILAVQYRMLTQIRLRGFVGMFLLLIASLAAGWLLGGRGAGLRKAMSLSTAVRNVGVGLVIAAASFPGTPAVTAALAFGLFQTIVVALISLGWGRVTPPPAGGATEPTQQAIHGAE